MHPGALAAGTLPQYRLVVLKHSSFYLDGKRIWVELGDSSSDVWTSKRQTWSHNSHLHKDIEKHKVLSVRLKKLKSSFLWSRVRNGDSLKGSLCYEMEPPRAKPFQNDTAYLICWLRDFSSPASCNEGCFRFQNIPRWMPRFKMKIITWSSCFFIISIRSLHFNLCILQTDGPFRPSPAFFLPSLDTRRIQNNLSLSLQYSHLLFGLPTFLLQSGFPRSFFFTVPSSDSLTKRPAHSSLPTIIVVKWTICYWANTLVACTKNTTLRKVQFISERK